MSRVTNFLLTFDSLEQESDGEGKRFEPVDRVNAAILDETQAHFLRVDHAAGGYKVFEKPVFAAAFNFVEENFVFEAIARAGWAYPENVQVFICGEEEEVFREWRILL